VSDLFTMLNIAAGAMDAQLYGMDTAGQNIANVNTPGFAKRSVVFEELPPLDPWSPGGGVNVQALIAARATLIQPRLLYEQPASSREGAIADHLAILEANLGKPGASLDAALAAFYNTYGDLANNPTSPTTRQQVILQGQALARTFNALASNFQTAQLSADQDVRDTVDQINALANQLADINAGIAAVGADNAQGLLDQQDVTLSKLSELINISTIQKSDGTVDVTIGSGRPLVVGSNTFALDAASGPPNGFVQVYSTISSTPVDITSEITGGRLGGVLYVRDTLVPQYTSALDSLAYNVMSDVNALTATGFDLNGNAGQAFFVQPGSATGAAATMAVTSAVAADSSLVVASATTAAGNNDVARAIAALQDNPMTGTTARPVDGWGNLVYQVASDSRAATQARDGHDQVMQQLKNLRDQISGVSIDEEAALLLKFQRAYEANAKFFQVTNETLSLLVSLVNG
jgi:flagellar hook-associated protein 1 FlgK